MTFYTFPATVVHFPSIYKPEKPLDEMGLTPRYGVSILAEDLPAALVYYVSTKRRVYPGMGDESIAMARLRSRYAPRVSFRGPGSGSPALRQMFDDAEIANIPRDGLIARAPAILGVELREDVEVHRPEGKTVFDMVVLRAIEFHIDDIRGNLIRLQTEFL